MFVILLHVLCSSLMSTFCHEVEEGLVTVITIYRHGDRTPITPYHNDPYRNTTFWPVDFGQLTNRGKQQHYRLGQWFRNRYKNFLPEVYSEKDVYVQSTDVDRTLMSAGANLAGLFPPKGKQVWNTALSWQPIPIHTNTALLDNILAMKGPCDRYKYLLDNLMNSDEFIDIQQKNRDLYDYVSKNTGEKIETLNELLYIYDTLKIEKIYNYTLPEWTKSIFPERMTPLAELTFAIECYTSKLARLKIGPLLNDIHDHLLNSTNNAGYKYIAYSAHDITVANVLNSLQLVDRHCPPYGATILFELRLLNGTYFVNMLYKDSAIPKEITLKDCEFYCPLDQFIQILTPLLITPKQWREECEFKFLGYISYSVLQRSIFIISILLLILIIAVLAVAYSRFKAQGTTYMPLPRQETMYS